ncbi:MAG: hypothetical protein BWY76_02834 [bacterium ADurb.Bin429]|nr:MAG: hypothetical protein BWY76_02834 [bacterium ADurb.Bin429]
MNCSRTRWAPRVNFQLLSICGFMTSQMAMVGPCVTYCRLESACQYAAQRVFIPAFAAPRFE